MTDSLRTPALRPPPIRSAVARDADPSTDLEQHFQQILATRMGDLPFIHPDLGVAAVGFGRHQDDWLGVMITPWFLNLFLLSGGGRLWGDIPAGERRYISLPCGTLQFIADDDPNLGPYQYCPLIAPVTSVPDMASAVQMARDAMQTVLASPPPTAPSTPEPVPFGSKSGETNAPPPRRAFFRRIAGKR